MKKALRGVLDGLRVSSLSQQNRIEVEVEESLKVEDFQLAQTVRHGFPYQPYCMSFDPVQHILAIGTRQGSLRLFGRPGVDCHLQHDGDVIILQCQFLINEGTLLTMCSDDTVSLWDFKQKPPAIAHSLKFQRESLTYCHLPFQSKWLYVGTVRGNVHIVNIESLFLSGYVINWNKAIELLRKTHPGQVVHLSDHPMDPSKLLIGYDSGTVVLWDLKSKTAELRFQCQDSLRSVTWQQDGKSIMCGLTDGSLVTWAVKSSQTQKAQSIQYPHAKNYKDGKAEICKPISKLVTITNKDGEPFTVFAGGMPCDRPGQPPCITVIHGKNTTVLEMEHDIIDFCVLLESPYPNDYQDPYGIVVLLENDLVVIDLSVEGYPCFENPYPMDIHESPVTTCFYLADCPSDLIPAFYSVGSKQKKSGFSENEWPLKGGEWGASSCSYNELVLTGHADGSVKIWDATAVTLQVLYKLKTVKVFEKQSDPQDEDPFAIQMIHLDADSRLLTVAGNSHVLLFRFSKQESNVDIPALEISIFYEVSDDMDSPEVYDFPVNQLTTFAGLAHQGGSVDSYSSTQSEAKSDGSACVKVKQGGRKWAAGYQPELACLLLQNEGEPVSVITSLSLNSSFGLLSFGNECGIAIVDYIQKTCLLHLGTPDLYGSMDPYQRGPRSPKTKKDKPDISQQSSGDEGKSPTTEFPVPKPRMKKQRQQQQQRETEESEDAQTPENESDNDSRQFRYHHKSAPRPDELSGVSTHVWPVNDSETPGSETESDGNLLGVRPDNQKLCRLSSSPASIRENATDDSDVSPRRYRKDPAPFNNQGKAQSSEHIAGQDFNGAYPRPPASISAEHSPTTSWIKKRFVSRMNWKMRSSTKDSSESDSSLNMRQVAHMAQAEAQAANDQDSLNQEPVRMRRPRGSDRSEGNFSRSRSSSMSSLENITKEAVHCLTFAETYTRKNENFLTASLWVGTSLGSVLAVELQMPGPMDNRQADPVMITPSGTIFRLKGAILAIAFLDSNGNLIQPLSEQWKDVNRDSKGPIRQNTIRSKISPTSSTELVDRQFAVLCSEKTARIISLPSQTCPYKIRITDSSFVIKADVVVMNNSVCLACYIANGHMLVYSLPSLRSLLDTDFLPLMDIRIARTFTISNNGHALFFCSPSEMQKVSFSQETSDSVPGMIGDLFTTKEMPEAPKQSFFKNLFSGAPSVLDREDLFGEQSGKAPKGQAKYIPGTIQSLQAQSGAVTNEFSRTRQALLQRGEKLGELDDKTADMMLSAEQYSKSCHSVMEKYKNRKWYQL